MPEAKKRGWGLEARKINVLVVYTFAYHLYSSLGVRCLMVIS